jgi:hypothetical protein
MVSQPTMRCILGLRTCLLGLTAAFFLFAACGQSEGGRCQINSDCASGLICTNGSSGNGTCGPSITVVSNNDASPDLSVVSGPEVGIDAESFDTESVSVDASASAVDSDSIDAQGLD